MKLKTPIGLRLVAALLTVAPGCSSDGDNNTTVSRTLTMSPGTLFLTVGSACTAMVTSAGQAVTRESSWLAEH